MRVAWFLPHFNKDLLPNPSFLLGKELVKRGIDVYIVTPKVYEESLTEHIEGVKIYRSRDLYLPLKNFPYPIPIMFFKRAIQRVKYDKIDILCWHTYHYLHTAYLPFIRRITKKPTTLTVLSFPGICWIYPSKRINFVAYAYSLSLGKVILKAVDKVIIDFPHNALGAKFLGIPKNKLEFIPWGVDCNKFKPMPKIRCELRERYGISDEEIVIGYSGRLVPIKGVDVLISAVHKLLHGGEKVRLLIIGGSFRCTGGSVNKYEVMARSLLKDKVIITGWMKPEMVPFYWQMADIAVQPSYAESGGGGAMESSACGIPVIASLVGGLQDTVKDGYTGFHISCGNMNELYDKLKLLIDDSELRKKLGENARKFMKENFDLDVVVEKYIKLYSKLSDV